VIFSKKAGERFIKRRRAFLKRLASILKKIVIVSQKDSDRFIKR
jgi:hypothetical protein